jgi:hypothetical protein
MDRPGKKASTLSWLMKLFGVEPPAAGESSKPRLAPEVSLTPPAPNDSPLPPGRFRTTYERDDATLLRQLQQVNVYRGIIEEASRRYNFQPAIICGIGSRESQWGLSLQPSGPTGRGDFAKRPPKGERRTPEPPDGPGYGRGLMQIDYDWHEFARTGRWQDPRENVMYSCQVLDQARKFFQNADVELTSEQLLQATVAAYNGGATATLQAIQAGKDIDANTTGRDYAKEVLNRSGWFQLHGWR